MKLAAAVLLCCSAVILQAQNPINLSSSKQLRTVPGVPQRTNSLPIAMAVSPDKRYIAILNAGYGNVKSGYAQSIAILDLRSGQLTDYPDSRLKQRAHQTYFGGIAWSGDGAHLYASMASLSDPKGELPNDTGNGVAVYAFRAGKLTPESFMHLAPVQLALEKRTPKGLFKKLVEHEAGPYPAGIMVLNDGTFLVANNLADQVTIISGEQQRHIDLSTEDIVPSEYPLNVVAARNGQRAWVSLWNASAVAELDLAGGAVVRQIPLLPPDSATPSSSHPTALLLSPDEKLLYVAVTNRDKVAVIDTASGKVQRMLNTRLPDEEYGGAMPVALALSDNGKRLFVADASLDAVAVFDTASPKNDPLGFIPTEWYPTALAAVNVELIIAAGKGSGTIANGNLVAPPENAPPSTPANAPAQPRGQAAPAQQHPYIAGLIAGSVARLKIADIERGLSGFTQQVEEANLMRVRVAMPFAGKQNPIKHAIYIIKENRTYDQVFGDIKEANGDPSLVMYGEDITPNQHKLARQFGVVDNFYDSGEVSGDGHVWSTAAIPSDYLERWVPVNYRSGTEHTYDSEGFNSSGVPVLEGIPDVDDPGTGYLWENAARNHVTYRDYGEYAAGQWCTAISDEGYVPPPDRANCPANTVAKGEPLPANLGQPHGSPSPFPWKIPVLGGVVPMKPALRNHHVDLKFAPWNLDFPDQFRADEFINEFDGFVRAKQQEGKDELPALMIMRLGNDHTSGTRVGHATPKAAVADNDLAVGRIADAVSHSPYWDDTAIFVVEDDAQNGADHVDAHRSTALVISKYSPLPQKAQGGTFSTVLAPFVDHNFYTTVNMIHTIEALLGLPPMNNNDARAPVMAPLFTGAGAQPAFAADYANRDNGLIYQMNQPTAPGAHASAKLDFTHADAADANTLNRILWRDAKGKAPMPKPQHNVIPAGAADDDDQ